MPRTYDPETDLPNCFACNNPFQKNEEVFLDDGEIYCKPCAVDVGIVEVEEKS